MKLIFWILTVTTTLLAFPVSLSDAETAAGSRLRRDGELDSRTVSNSFSIENDHSDHPLAYVFEILPHGYIVTSADDDLPPIIAYSYTSNCRNAGEENSILIDVVRSDLELRLRVLDQISLEYRAINNILWEEYVTGVLPGSLLEQWPPEGSTPSVLRRRYNSAFPGKRVRWTMYALSSVISAADVYGSSWMKLLDPEATGLFGMVRMTAAAGFHQESISIPS